METEKKWKKVVTKKVKERQRWDKKTHSWRRKKETEKKTEGVMEDLEGVRRRWERAPFSGR